MENGRKRHGSWTGVLSRLHRARTPASASRLARLPSAGCPPQPSPSATRPFTNMFCAFCAEARTFPCCRIRFSMCRVGLAWQLLPCVLLLAVCVRAALAAEPDFLLSNCGNATRHGSLYLYGRSSNGCEVSFTSTGLLHRHRQCALNRECKPLYTGRDPRRLRKREPLQFPLVALSTVPRSGNSWVRQLFEKATRLPTATSIVGEVTGEPLYVVKDGETQHVVPPCGKVDNCEWLRTERLPADLVLSKAHQPFLTGGMWTAYATHALLSARNPVANWNAWVRFYRDRSVDGDAARAASKFLAFAAAWGHHHAFWHRRAAADCLPLAVFRFEDLLADTAGVLQALLDDLPLPANATNAEAVAAAAEMYSAAVAPAYAELAALPDRAAAAPGDPAHDWACRDHALVQGLATLPRGAVITLLGTPPTEKEGRENQEGEEKELAADDASVDEDDLADARFFLAQYGYDDVLRAALRGGVACVHEFADGTARATSVHAGL